MSTQLFWKGTAKSLQRCQKSSSSPMLLLRKFCSVDVPHVKENPLSKMEEENKKKILEARAKHLPSSSLINPFEKEKAKCILCQLDIRPDYKNVRLLSQFISPYTGRVYGRHITGLCKYKQEQVQAEIVKAQSAGIMATMLKDVKFLNDPKLFDPEKPIRPHRF